MNTEKGVDEIESCFQNERARFVSEVIQWCFSDSY